MKTHTIRLAVLTLLLLAAALVAGLIGAHHATMPRPNVVMIIIDTLRADKLGAYGFPLNISPEIDALAKAGNKI